MASQADVVKEADQIQQAAETDNQEFANPIITSPSNGNDTNNLSAAGDVCRDFLRNCCRRGPNCRFNHPELNDGKKCEIPLLTFCHDFQNRECRRPNCKFVHCSKQDEELFKQTGRLPEVLNYGLSAGSQSGNGLNGNQTNPNNGNKFNGPKKFIGNNPNNGAFPQASSNFKEQEAPVCKDFVKGDCFRGAKCKFKHVGQPDRNFNGSNKTFDNSFESAGFQNSAALMQPAQRFDQMNQMKSSSPMSHPVNRENSSFQLPVDRRNNMRGTPMFEPDAKRRAFDSGYNTPTTFTFANNNANSQLLVTNALSQIHSNASHPSNANTSNPETSSQSAQTAVLAAAVNAINELNGSNVTTSSSANTITRSMYNNLNESRFLLEENNNLRREIDKLKQQVVDLMNANEFLLEQNAQLRNSIMPATSVNQKLAVSTTLHNQVAALHSSTVVQKAPASNPVVPTSSQPTSLQATLPPHINPSTISNTELLVANHLHRQSQQINQQRAAAAAVAAVASATSSALSSMSSNPLTSNPLSSNPLSAASSISSLTVTSTSAPLVSYPIIQPNNPIMSASIPHSLGHLTH